MDPYAEITAKFAAERAADRARELSMDFSAAPAETARLAKVAFETNTDDAWSALCESIENGGKTCDGLFMQIAPTTSADKSRPFLRLCERRAVAEYFDSVPVLPSDNNVCAAFLCGAAEHGVDAVCKMYGLMMSAQDQDKATVYAALCQHLTLSASPLVKPRISKASDTAFGDRVARMFKHACQRGDVGIIRMFLNMRCDYSHIMYMFMLLTKSPEAEVILGEYCVDVALYFGDDSFDYDAIAVALHFGMINRVHAVLNTVRNNESKLIRRAIYLAALMCNHAPKEDVIARIDRVMEEWRKFRAGAQLYDIRKLTFAIDTPAYVANHAYDCVRDGI